MTLPETTKKDIEDDEVLDIVVQFGTYNRYPEGNTEVAVRDINGDEFLLRIWDGDHPDKELEEGRWVVLKDVRGDVYEGTVKVGSNYGNFTLEYLDSPPAFTTIDVEESKEQVSEGGIIALDIETISTVEESEFSFENSDHVELLCIGVGYAPWTDLPGTSTVIFRNGPSREAEAKLLVDLCNYIEQYDADLLVTYKGSFDHQHLLGRAKRLTDVESALDYRVGQLFETHRWKDLDPIGSLEENTVVQTTYWDIYHHSLEPADWREDHPRYDGELDSPVVMNLDIPHFGARYLTLKTEAPESTEARALEELLRRYTTSDIDPLFTML